MRQSARQYSMTRSSASQLITSSHAPYVAIHHVGPPSSLYRHLPARIQRSSLKRAALVVARPDARRDILPHPALLLATDAVDLLGHLALRVWLPSALPLHHDATTPITHPLAVRARLEEDNRRLAVPALHREVERRVTRPVGGVEARLWPTLRWVEKNREEGAVASRRCAVEGMLRSTVLGIDLYVSVVLLRSAAEGELTSAPRVMRRRPICLSAQSTSHTDLADPQEHSPWTQRSAVLSGPCRSQRPPWRQRQAES